MKMCDFELSEPKNLGDALTLLKTGENSRIIAGGTDILVDLKHGNVVCSRLVGLSSLDELKGIKMETMGGSEILCIGAMTTLNQVAYSPLINAQFPGLAEAALSMSSNQIRNAATIGGNIMSAVPSADLPPVLVAAEARVEVAGAEGKRVVPLDDFFLGPRNTIVGPGEILVSIQTPSIRSNTGISYCKLKLRGANALAVAATAAKITLVEGKITNSRIVLGAVAPIPLYVPKISDFLEGKTPGEEVFEEAATMAASESRPISDIRASLEYRKELVEVLTFRSLVQATIRAGGGL